MLLSGQDPHTASGKRPGCGPNDDTSGLRAGSLSCSLQHARHKSGRQTISRLRQLLHDWSDGRHRSPCLGGQEHARDTGHGDAAPTRDLPPGELVDEQEPCVELLGQCDRFSLAVVQKLREFQNHVPRNNGLNGDPLRGHGAGERSRARTSGPDREFPVHRRRNHNVLVQATQEVEPVSTSQADERPRVGNDRLHEATPTSSSSSSGG